MQAAFDQLEAGVNEFESCRSQLTPEISASEFLEIVHQYERLNHLASRISGFASLSFAADTQDQSAMAFNGRVDQFMAEVQKQLNVYWKQMGY